MIKVASNEFRPAFTIVELLVVIVVIGILASLTIVSFTGVSNQAIVATLQSDLKNASTQLELNKVSDLQELYPPDLPSANEGRGIIASPDVTYGYKYNAIQNSYCITATSDANNISYFINSDNSVPQEGLCSMETGIVAWGGVGREYGKSLSQAEDDGYVVYGYTDAHGAGGNDALLVKYSSAGTFSWSRTWGGTGFDRGYSVVSTSDGSYAVTGESSSYGAGSADMFLAKYDSSGTLLWSRTWGGTGSDKGNYLIQTNDGGYAITGVTSSFGETNGDMFLAKYDSSGTLLWSRSWGGTGTDSGSSLVQTTDDGYAVLGNTTSYSAGSYDISLIKYDASGTLSWNQTWGGANIEISNSVIQTSDGGYAVAGRTQSYGAGSNDGILLKYNSSGTLSWRRTWGSATVDEGFSLVQTLDGGYLSLGITNAYGAGNFDAILLKHDSAGNLSWSRTWGGSGADYGYSLIKTTDGGYAVAGTTPSYGAGNEDIFLIKYNSLVNILNCFSPMCQSPSPSIQNPSASISSPTASISSPTASVSSPTATLTVIVAPQ